MWWHMLHRGGAPYGYPKVRDAMENLKALCIQKCLGAGSEVKRACKAGWDQYKTCITISPCLSPQRATRLGLLAINTQLCTRSAEQYTPSLGTKRHLATYTWAHTSSKVASRRTGSSFPL
eukprot:3777799-Rhodomonas_salina.2